MQDLKDMQQALKDSGLLSSDEAIVLMRVLSGEPVSSKMLDKLPSALGKIVPTIIEKLVAEYLKALENVKNLENKIETNKEIQENEREIYLQLVSEEHPTESQLAKLPIHARNLVKNYSNALEETGKIREELVNIQEDVEKITHYVKSVRADEEPLDQYEISDELLPLANAIVSLVDTITERLKNKMLSAVEEGLKTGTYTGLSNEVIEAINKLIIRRLEEILKPYEDLSRQYVAGEISHEEFTDSLKRNALLNHMREQVISDTIKAVEEGRIDAPEIPPKLKTAIQNLVNGGVPAQTGTNTNTGSSAPIAGPVPNDSSGLF